MKATNLIPLIERLIEAAKHPEYPQADPPIVAEAQVALAVLYQIRDEERVAATEEDERTEVLEGTKW